MRQERIKKAYDIAREISEYKTIKKQVKRYANRNGAVRIKLLRPHGKHKSQMKTLLLPTDIAEYIIQKCNDNIKQLKKELKTDRI